MTLTFDKNLFTQVDLDSGSLTMLGTVVHKFEEPGEYRGSVHQVGGPQTTFYISVDKNSSAAQVNIDLASLSNSTATNNCGCDSTPTQFSVNAKGYVVFHVSGGAGGYDIHMRRAEENPEEKVFNSQILGDGDIFSASIIRPGTYSVTNTHTKAEAEVIVAYPHIGGEEAYRPPAPVRVKATQKGFEPHRIELKPGQGLIFEIEAPSRIRIDLRKPDDGPKDRQPSPKRGWKKSISPVNKT